MERRPRISDRTHPPSMECCQPYAKQPRCGLCVWGFGVRLTLLIVNKTGKACALHLVTKAFWVGHRLIPRAVNVIKERCGKVGNIRRTLFKPWLRDRVPFVSCSIVSRGASRQMLLLQFLKFSRGRFLRHPFTIYLLLALLFYGVRSELLISVVK